MMLVSSFLEQSAAANPKNEALICGHERLAYADLDERASLLCDTLLDLGLRKQERVAIHLGNSIEAVIAIFAALKAGAVFVVLNPLLPPRKLMTILDNSGAACVLTGSLVGVQCGEKAANVRFLLVGDGVVAQASSNSIKPCYRLRPLLETETPAAKKSVERCHGRDICSLIYTSGSTGAPKGVAMSNNNMVAAATSILEYLSITGTDTVLNVLPLSSDYGLYNVLMPIWRGSRVVLERPFLHPGQLIGSLNEEGVTGLPLTPTIVAILRRFRRLGIRAPERVRWITSTGQALPPAHSRWLRTTFPAARVYSMYGVTECKRVSYLPPEELETRPTSVGKAIPNTKVHLTDADGTKIQRAGEIGELVVQGPHVMQGYWNLPGETAEILNTGAAEDDRQLKTGDLFTADEEGYLYFVGRRDGLIKSGGYRVSPREVEDVVHELKEVCEVAAFGVPHDVLGQVLRLIVVLQEESTITEQVIRDHCECHLEKYMIPKKIEIRRRLPTTNAGKVDYRALAAEHGDIDGEGEDIA